MSPLKWKTSFFVGDYFLVRAGRNYVAQVKVIGCRTGRRREITEGRDPDRRAVELKVAVMRRPDPAEYMITAAGHSHRLSPLQVSSPSTYLSQPSRGQGLMLAALSTVPI